MPLGFQRLNERTQRPNEYINFIKPLETPHKADSEDFLQRIAAQCYPVMKKHHISVMTLEEYEPNPEFLGRNFNAGEVIQLVLKDKSGRWLSMKFVQMVMMHELAHCKQMNHSRFFWSVRNEYAKHMEELWQGGYLGEGMWGRGRGLDDGAFVNAQAPDATQIPEHLCGGSYRRRRRKRKRGRHAEGDQPAKLSYAERQQRRIARKFGVHGEGAALGEDDLMRGALETMNGGKRSQGKPKVANSKRGRELRANAALVRFQRMQAEPKDRLPKAEPHSDSETESEWEEGGASAGVEQGSDVVIKDEHGHDLIKVCGDEAEDDEDGAGREMDELRLLSSGKSKPTRTPPLEPGIEDRTAQDSETGSEQEEVQRGVKNKEQKTLLPMQHRDSETEPESETSLPRSSTLACPVCSLENDVGAPTCIACAHVLRQALIPNCWRCRSEACKNTKYVNAGDAGRCGLCGALKPNAVASEASSSSKPMGITRAELLRWD